jgi:hypothetical protein
MRHQHHTYDYSQTYLYDTPLHAILGISRMLALETNKLWELPFMRKSFLKRHVTTI